MTRSHLITVPDTHPDPSLRGTTVHVSEELLNRLIQEEVWSQTVWPMAEPSVNEQLDELFEAYHRPEHERDAIDL